MAYLLAIVSAAFYGAADFLGGMASRRASAIVVVFAAQLSGLIALLLILPLLPRSAPSALDLIWGGTAGVAGGVGVALLYRALAVGTMAVVAPTTAVCAVILPVVAEAVVGERPTPLTTAGIGLALVAIVLVSRQAVGRAEADTSRLLPPGIWLALASGVAIGLFFLALARVKVTAGLWPLVGARTASVVLCAVVALATARSLRLAVPVAGVALAAGLIDMCANVLYLVATRHAPLNVVVPLSSLYPASTVLLARVVLGERLSAWQITGVACALAAIALIVRGDAHQPPRQASIIFDIAEWRRPCRFMAVCSSGSGLPLSSRPGT